MSTIESEFITDFWRTWYLDTYIADGGSKIKFVTGSPGSGKSRVLQHFLAAASRQNYLTVPVSAKVTWLHDFKEIYLTAMKSVDFPLRLRACADAVVRELGYDPDEIPAGTLFADYLLEKDMLDPLTKREIREALNKMFLKDPGIDNNFALCAALITGGLLGYPALEPASLDLLMGWLQSEKGIRIPQLRKLGLSPARITKYNARHMLRSLVQVLRIAGYTGLAIGVDDLEILTSVSSLEEIRYTKMRREDAYESIRELIDEIDTLSHIMFVFAFDKDLLEDEIKGLKSYQALWMRLQNEISGSRVNRFADIINMDEVRKQLTASASASGSEGGGVQ